MTQFEVLLLQAQINSMVGMLSSWPTVPNRCCPDMTCPETVTSRSGYVPKRPAPLSILQEIGVVFVGVFHFPCKASAD